MSVLYANTHYTSIGKIEFEITKGNDTAICKEIDYAYSVYSSSSNPNQIQIKMQMQIQMPPIDLTNVIRDFNAPDAPRIHRSQSRMSDLMDGEIQPINLTDIFNQCVDDQPFQLAQPSPIGFSRDTLLFALYDAKMDMIGGINTVATDTSPANIHAMKTFVDQIVRSPLDDAKLRIPTQNEYEIPLDQLDECIKTIPNAFYKTYLLEVKKKLNAAFSSVLDWLKEDCDLDHISNLLAYEEICIG